MKDWDLNSFINRAKIKGNAQSDKDKEVDSNPQDVIVDCLLPYINAYNELKKSADASFVEKIILVMLESGLTQNTYLTLLQYLAK
jgi:hypothetical protein